MSVGTYRMARAVLLRCLQTCFLRDISTIVECWATAKTKLYKQPPRSSSGCWWIGAVLPREARPCTVPFPRSSTREQNPFGLALFNPWPERGAVELWNGDKESKMFHPIIKITAGKGGGCEGASEHMDREERGICGLRQRVRVKNPQFYSILYLCDINKSLCFSQTRKLGYDHKPPPHRVVEMARTGLVRCGGGRWNDE